VPLDVPRAARSIGSTLRRAGDPDRASHEKRYLKSDLQFFGMSVREIRRVLRAFADERPELDHSEVVDLVLALWKRPVFELRMSAVELLRVYGYLLEPSDLPLVERLIRDSKTWALVDVLAPAVAGPLVERFPKLGTTLDRWAADEDFWVRRAALLALLEPLRRGDGDFPRFGRYADAMLDEREFFIRKAIGWVLRETAKKQPAMVYRWLKSRVKRASGVTVREAVKYLPEKQRRELLAAFRQR
jgi:3-methyladenine DNA glycosylase AlkD